MVTNHNLYDSPLLKVHSLVLWPSILSVLMNFPDAHEKVMYPKALYKYLVKLVDMFKPQVAVL